VNRPKATLSGAAAACLILLASSQPGALAAQSDEAGPPPREYFDLDIPLIGGGTLPVVETRGKILVVDVWGTWCGTCRVVIPHLIEIEKQFAPRGVKVIGISAEVAGTVEEASRRILRYASEMGMNYSLGILDEEIYQRIRSLMRFEGDLFTVPSTFVVDTDGEVIARYPGYFSGQEKDLVAFLEERLEREPAVEMSP
jgi:thiol-disulfide isomerase/thioredoxin